MNDNIKQVFFIYDKIDKPIKKTKKQKTQNDKPINTKK